MNNKYQKLIAILFGISTFVLYQAPNEVRVMAQKMTCVLKLLRISRIQEGN